MMVKSFFSGFVGLLAGLFFSQRTMKSVYVAAVMVCGLATALLYFVHDLWAYYAIAALSGTAGIVAGIALQVSLARWFSARLGQATGFALLGGAMAGLTVPLGMTYLVEAYGWRAASGIAGLAVMGPLAVAVLILSHDSPERYGSSAEELDPPAKGSEHPVSQIGEGEDFRDILRSRAFWFAMIAIFCSGAVDGGVNEHTPLFLARQGNYGSYMAALGLTGVIAIGGLGKIAFGWLFDRFSTRGVALCWLLGGAATALAFPVAGMATFLAFMIARGLAHGGIVVDIPIVAKHLFGAKSVGRVIAFLSAASHIGTGAGAGAVGFAYDLLGNYDIPFAFMIGLSVVSTALILSIAPRYWVGYRAPSPKTTGESAFPAEPNAGNP
jgi:MFS family permease